MIIGKVPVTAITYGGYVNVSRQDIDWTQPAIMDIVINDLAAQYAQRPRTRGDALVAGGDRRAARPRSRPGRRPPPPCRRALDGGRHGVHRDQGPGPADLAVSPDMLGLLGPLFPPVNPQNAQSAGFTAADFGTGAIGTISGIPVVVSAQLATGTMIVVSTAAAEVYEDRIGSLQVVEPSVLGVQVAYAGYFAAADHVSATGIQKIVKTP